MVNEQNPELPWLNNDKFLEFVTAYKRDKFMEFQWKRVSQDNFCLKLKESYVDDDRYLPALILCLKSRMMEAKLRTMFDDQRDGLWAVWFDIQDIGTMHRKEMAPEFQPLLDEISDVMIPYLWGQFKTNNK